jgi:hypothetical protein
MPRKTTSRKVVKKRLPKLRSKKTMSAKINFAAWEVKKSYDDVIKAIGRNRKRILELFI